MLVASRANWYSVLNPSTARTDCKVFLRAGESASERYVIITPVRDEENYIRATIESVIRQTIRPVEWVIVNDGSTDNTGSIIDRYASQFPWIRMKHRSNRGFRHPGGGVVEAFYDGYNSLCCEDWDFIAKLDGDLSFAPDYFEKLFRYFRTQARLGIAGGTLWCVVNGKGEVEKGPKFHVRGATKVYRKACWTAVGGIWRGPGWDTIDEVKANMLGWTTESFPDLRVIHHRLTGTAESKWSDRVKSGRANYVAGYHPIFMVAKCLYRLARKPYIIGSIAMFYGFISGYLGAVPRVSDPALVRYLRREQLRRLFRRETIWK